jgi:prepilin-type N-terminal cleavage/methylation domain-containing protein
MPRRSGLTLIELVAAVTITALLMTGAMTAVRALARSEKLRQGQEGTPREWGSLEDLLRADILHAEKFRKAAKGQWLAFQTRSSLEDKALELEHLRCWVRYEVRTIDSRPWLVRTQATGIRKPWTELVHADIASIDLKDADAKQAPPAADWGQAPWRAVVTILPAGRDAKPYTFTVWKK